MPRTLLYCHFVAKLSIFHPGSGIISCLPRAAFYRGSPFLYEAKKKQTTKKPPGYEKPGQFFYIQDLFCHLLRGKLPGSPLSC